MNRKQAESILKAYVSMIYARDAAGGDSDASEAIEALKDVILDAMSEYRTYTAPSITWPYTKPLTVPTTMPTKPSNIPYVTWTGEDSLGQKRTWEVNDGDSN